MLTGNKGVLTARLAGVTVARDATNVEGRGTPQTLLGVVEGSVHFFFYNDERGVAQSAMFFKVGDQLVTSADSEAWCKNLKPMSSWLQKKYDQYQVDEARRSKPVELPEGDEVDVTGDGG